MNGKTTAASVGVTAGALAAASKLVQKALGEGAKALGADPSGPTGPLRH